MIAMPDARVVVTGATGGVGRALCAVFRGAGARVVGCDVTDEGLAEIADECHVFDLLDGAAVAAAGAAIVAGGVPDAVISNAGWTRAETLADVDAAALSREVTGNFEGAAGLSLALLPAMRAARGQRSFVFIASVNALAHYGNPAYSAAKAATLAWVRAIATEEGRYGIRANAVIPASIRTRAWEHRLQIDPQILDRLSRLYPLGRIVTPEEVANAALFLASPMASGITGTSITVDAGITGSNLPFVQALSDLGA